MTTRHGARSAQPRRLRALLASELAELPAGIRPARRRDAFRTAVVFAHSIERHRRHPPRLRKLIPLRPLRLTMHWLTGLALALIPDMTMLAGSPSPLALLAVDQQTPEAQLRRAARALGWLAVFSLAVSPAAVLLALVAPGVIYDALQWTVSAVLGACVFRLVIANRQARALHTVGRRWAAKLPGPAWWLTGFGSLDPPAAIRLGRAVCDLADTAGAVLLAVTEGTAYIRAYQRAGFAVHRQVHVDQQPCALLVRWPRPGETQQPPTSRDAGRPTRSRRAGAARSRESGILAVG